MLKKSHVLALAVTTAGLIGFAAPMASAATTSFANHPGSSVVNVSGNQVPVQACGNDIYGNGIGGQVPAQGDALVGSLLSPGSVTKGSSTDNRGCGMINSSKTGGDSAGSSVINVANNQVPVQVCGNDGYINVIGGQVPLQGDAGALSLLSPAAITSSKAVDNRGCGLANSQKQGW
ncbi:MAG TPA: hypothetical protein VIZ43_30255 [Trebonia sp.]|jgi:hypothetical protein